MSKKDDRGGPVDRYTRNIEKRGKRGRGRPSKLIDPDDPTTWPKKLQTKREKIMYLFDILSGNKPGTYKQKWIDEKFGDKTAVQLRMSKDILEDIADINAIWKHGGFKNIPLPVAEGIMMRFSTRPEPITEDDLYNYDPAERPLSPQDVIALSLLITKFYFMGANPVFAYLMKKTTDVYGNEVGLRHLAATASRMATYANMFEVDL